MTFPTSLTTPRREIVRLSSLIEEEAVPKLRFRHARESMGLDQALRRLSEAEDMVGALEERIRYLEGLALTDELTGLVNRRGFGLALRREIAAARRSRNAVGYVVMLDLDGFKGVNDHWGHPVGDMYLHTVGRVLSDSVRSSDLVARMGGDEFAILLTHISARDGEERLTRIEKNFRRKVMHWKEEALPLRASFGGAAYLGVDAPDAILSRADAALYAAKQGKGRES